MKRVIARPLHSLNGRRRLSLWLLMMVVMGSGWLALADDEPELWARTGVERQLTLDQEALAARLARVGPESGSTASTAAADDGEPRVELPLPMPDGSIVRFWLAESPVLEPALAAKHPEIRTYAGRAVDNPALGMRGTLTPAGFEALVLLPDRLVSIRPERRGDGGNYVSVEEAGGQPGGPAIRCEVREAEAAGGELVSREAEAVSIGGARRTYRLALGATWEYAERFGGGTVAGTVAAMATLLNRANAIYERELAIRFLLVDAPALIYSTAQGFSAGSDPFTAGDNDASLRQFAPLLAGFGRERFDVAHLLGWGASGLAYPGTACRETDLFGGPVKGLAASSLSHDLGDQGNLSLFVHELGHQFGARHSFNGSAGYCGYQQERVPESALEPGSGSTVMAYGGLCDSDNLTSYASGSLRFHFGSIEQILGYLGGAGNCFQAVATTNTPPVVEGGPDYTIPRLTPFELRATGADPDAGDRLTYVWDQVDAGGGFINPPYSDRDDGPGSTRPIFRSYEPEADGGRLFPSRRYILEQANDPPETIGGYRTAESLPAVGRILNFGVMLRDNRVGGSGLSLDRVQLTVAPQAGPFRVVEPNGGMEWMLGLPQVVRWEVAGTDRSPVNCQQVRISLSLDDGETYPVTLREATANDGEEVVWLAPELGNLVGEKARVRVAAVGNIFFDVSDARLAIVSNRILAPGRQRRGAGPARPGR